MARSAQRVLGLTLGVLGVTDKILELDAALADIQPELMLVALKNADDETIGLAALDAEARAAVVEMQTIGMLRAAKAEERKITATDAALAVPLLDQLLTDIAGTAEDSVLDGWANGCHAGRPVTDADAALLILPSGKYRLAELTLDLGGDARQGILLLLLPSKTSAKGTKPNGSDEQSWEQALETVVMTAPTDLLAVLTRLKLPLSQIEGFEIDQMLPLHGVTVASVRLEGPGGRVFAKARLGQISGMRAVRVEDPDPLRMTENEGPKAGATKRQLSGK